MTSDSAEAAALGILGWLIGEDEILPVFLGASGVPQQSLRDRAGEPEFLASLVDFVMMDDAWVLAASQAGGWPPERITEIRAALPGGDLPNWT